MSGYVIAQVKVHDREEYRKYQLDFMAASKPFGVRVLVATEDVEVLEGEWPQVRTIVMEYPSMDRAREWYRSDQYQRVAHHRLKAATTNMILADGFSAK